MFVAVEIFEQQKFIITYDFVGTCSPLILIFFFLAFSGLVGEWIIGNYAQWSWKWVILNFWPCSSHWQIFMIKCEIWSFAHGKSEVQSTITAYFQAVNHPMNCIEGKTSLFQHHNSFFLPFLVGSTWSKKLNKNNTCPWIYIAVWGRTQVRIKRVL